MRRAPTAVTIAAARITAVAVIEEVIVAVTADAVDVGAVVADAIVAVVPRVLVDATCLPPNTPHRRAANHAAMKIAVAISEARKIAAASRVVSSLVALRSAVLTIARLKPPVPPRPALPQKNRFFFPANL